MNTLSKVLAVAVFAMSLAFLGFVSVMIVGGPNWGAERVALLSDGYTFDKSEGEIVQWTAKLKGAAVGGATTVQPQAIINARKDLQRKQSDELNGLETRIPRMEQDLTRLEHLVEVDNQAITNRRESLQAQIDALRAEHLRTATDIQARADEGRETLLEVRARRHDVFRVDEQVEELNADASRLRDEKALLESRLTIIEGNNAQLERRRRRLAGQLGTTVPDDSAADSVPTPAAAAAVDSDPEVATPEVATPEIN